MPVFKDEMAVDNLIFLEARVCGHRHHTGAVLVASGHRGFVQFWWVRNGSALYDEFYAPHAPASSVTAMVTDPTNSILVTGDTEGCIGVWNIEKYALSASKPGMRTKPRLLNRYRAHTKTIVSIQYIVHGELNKEMLLTASKDCTVRLWTIKGIYIGIFGQEKSWDINNIQTFGLGKMDTQPLPPSVEQVERIKTMVRNTTQERRNSSAERRARIHKFQTAPTPAFSASNLSTSSKVYSPNTANTTKTLNASGTYTPPDKERQGRHAFFDKMRRSKGGQSKKLRLEKRSKHFQLGEAPNNPVINPQRIYQSLDHFELDNTNMPTPSSDDPFGEDIEEYPPVPNAPSSMFPIIGGTQAYSDTRAQSSKAHGSKTPSAINEKALFPMLAT